MGWRRDAAKRRDAEERAVATMKADDLPWAGEKIRGLWWVDGMDGYFTEQPSGKLLAFDTRGKRVINLNPLSGKALDDYLELQDIGANLAWAAVNICGACKQVIRDCHCNDYPEF